MSHPDPKHDSENTKPLRQFAKSKAIGSAKIFSKGRKALALMKMKNKGELNYAKSFDKKFGSIEDRVKKFGKEMK